MPDDKTAAGHGEGKGNGVRHKIFVNDVEHEVFVQAMSGAQIKALGNVPSDYQLFLEQPGEDKPIGDADSVKLHDGMKFFALPPATFG